MIAIPREKANHMPGVAWSARQANMVAESVSTYWREDIADETATYGGK
jgi:hypothetical protein